MHAEVTTGESSPVLEVKGGSVGSANTQPQCSWPSRVFCQVGWTTERPMTSSRPCASRMPSRQEG